MKVVDKLIRKKLKVRRSKVKVTWSHNLGKAAKVGNGWPYWLQTL